MANEVGKRYVCKKCGSEFIVTRGGKGTLKCCNQSMELKKQVVKEFCRRKIFGGDITNESTR